VSTNYRYPVSRTPRERYIGRNEYLQKRVQLADAQLCQVMQRAVDELRKSCGKRLGSRDGWEGFPWLTMVFGSGALELNETSAEVAPYLADQVQELIRQQNFPWNEQADDAPPTLAHKFTLALARDRMGRASQHADDQEVSSTQPAERVAARVEPVAAKMVYLALLLTEFFYKMRAVMGQPTSRWENESATLTDATPARASSEATELIRQVRSLIRDVRRALQQSEETKARKRVRNGVDKLLDRITAGLDATGDDNRRELRIDHLRLITEVAWYFLILNTPIYPGWTDMLLNLMLRELNRPDRSFASPRPRYLDLRALIESVKDIYEPPTTNSWRRNMARPFENGAEETTETGRVPAADSTLAKRDRLYWAAAQVLWAQHKAQKEIDALKAQLPPTVAFVTSFDLELDMALLASAGDRMFRVAVPVHVVDKASDKSQVTQAELCWFLGDVVPQPDVPPADQINFLRNPARWRLLTSDFNPDELRDTPIVIHLSGCPLFNLPAPDKMPDLATAGLAEWPEVDFFHAVTVDEYLALRQSEAELIWSSDDSGGGKRNRALPQDLMINKEDLANPRFWLSMGVPVADPAVRHRLVSQLTRQRLAGQRRSNPNWAPAPAAVGGGGDADTGSMLGPPPPEEIVLDDLLVLGADEAGALGVAVNTRIGDDETNLLYWMGWDVVEGDCNEFAEDLGHYTLHIGHTGRYKQPPLTVECELTRDNADVTND
jgi:hypothetical protein